MRAQQQVVGLARSVLPMPLVVQPGATRLGPGLPGGIRRRDHVHTGDNALGDAKGTILVGGQEGLVDVGNDTIERTVTATVPAPTSATPSSAAPATDDEASALKFAVHQAVPVADVVERMLAGGAGLDDRRREQTQGVLMLVESLERLVGRTPEIGRGHRPTRVAESRNPDRRRIIGHAPHVKQGMVLAARPVPGHSRSTQPAQKSQRGGNQCTTQHSAPSILASTQRVRTRRQ